VAARVLADFEHLLPATGRALDLACGTGGNALLLAQHGLETWAWDISDTAVTQLQALARDSNAGITVQQRDVVCLPPDPGSFDVIVVSRFLDRDLIPAICRALREHGLIFYQTFTREKPPGCGPGNPDYLLEVNELLFLFKSLRIIYYREDGNIGDTARGFRNEAMLIAQKA
jgi:SAM-dependent methyltransferase